MNRILKTLVLGAMLYLTAPREQTFAELAKKNGKIGATYLARV
jgi:hypothetical protein